VDGSGHPRSATRPSSAKLLNGSIKECLVHHHDLLSHGLD
jgi:hypothetical protein